MFFGWSKCILLWYIDALWLTPPEKGWSCWTSCSNMSGKCWIVILACCRTLCYSNHPLLLFQAILSVHMHTCQCIPPALPPTASFHLLPSCRATSTFDIIHGHNVHALSYYTIDPCFFYLYFCICFLPSYWRLTLMKKVCKKLEGTTARSEVMRGGSSCLCTNKIRGSGGPLFLATGVIWRFACKSL